jgi:hypothetical protein
MSKVKELIFSIVEQYENGLSVKTISDIEGLNPEVVLDILQQYSTATESTMATTLQ